MQHQISLPKVQKIAVMPARALRRNRQVLLTYFNSLPFVVFADTAQMYEQKALDRFIEMVSESGFATSGTAAVMSDVLLTQIVLAFESADYVVALIVLEQRNFTRFVGYLGRGAGPTLSLYLGSGQWLKQ
jgi:hypothetical protein